MFDHDDDVLDELDDDLIVEPMDDVSPLDAVGFAPATALKAMIGGTATIPSARALTRPPVRGSVTVRAPAQQARIQAAGHEVLARSLAHRMSGGLPDAAHLQLARQTVRIPEVADAVKLLRKAQVSRQASHEHRSIVGRDRFRADVQKKLDRILHLMGQGGGEQTIRIAFGKRRTR